MTTTTALSKALSTLARTGARSATVYLSDRLTVKATRVRYRYLGRRPDPDSFEARVTVGRPNYAARAFIRLATRAGESFPIRKVQLTGVPA